MTEISFSHLVRRKPNFSKGLNLVTSKGEENILLIQQSLVFSIEHILTIFRPSVEISLQVSKTSSSTPILSTIFSDNELVQWDLNDSLKYNFPRDDMTEKKKRKKKYTNVRLRSMQISIFYEQWIGLLSQKGNLFLQENSMYIDCYSGV